MYSNHKENEFGFTFFTFLHSLSQEVLLKLHCDFVEIKLSILNMHLTQYNSCKSSHRLPRSGANTKGNFIFML